MSSTEVSIIVGTVCTALTALITLACTKGVDAWLKVRADNRIDENSNEAAEDNVLRYTISRQDARIDKLESELRALHHEHNDCERKYAALSARLEKTECDIQAVKQERQNDVRESK